MKIAISGSTGFIGKHLVRYLTKHGHQVVPVGRTLLQEDSFRQLMETLNGCNAVINLAGAPDRCHASVGTCYE